jgi:hypothetical protein
MAGRKADPIIISSFPGSPPCACLSADRGGELHSLKRERGTIERSEISPGRSNAGQNSKDLLGGEKRTAEIKKTEETLPNGTVSLSNP